MPSTDTVTALWGLHRTVIPLTCPYLCVALCTVRVRTATYLNKACALRRTIHGRCLHVFDERVSILNAPVRRDKEALRAAYLFLYTVRELQLLCRTGPNKACRGTRISTPLISDHPDGWDGARPKCDSDEVQMQLKVARQGERRMKANSWNERKEKIDAAAAPLTYCRDKVEKWEADKIS